MGAMDAAASADGLNFELPEEIRMLREAVRKFVDRELIPIERNARVNNKLKPEIYAELTTKAQALGLSGYDVPREYGGVGLGLIAKVTVWAELGRSIALPPRGGDIFGPNVSPILYHLNEAQKKKYLLPTLRGELKWCLAQTEPDAGGDPGSMRTTAVREGDHYIINGVKRFITGADDADYAQLIAATDRAKGSHGGISAFILDMKSPGVRLLRAQELVIDDRPWEIAFEDVKIPVEDRIGEEGDGFRHAQHWLNVGRIRHGARSLGVI
jgi:acyl-CoA dehydrogenase